MTAPRRIPPRVALLTAVLTLLLERQQFCEG